MKKAFLFIGLFFISSLNSAFGATSIANTTILTIIPVAIEVNSIRIDEQKLSNTCKNPPVQVKKVVQIKDDMNVLELSPIQLDILSNDNNPTSITGYFSSLTNGIYSFNPADLNVLPGNGQMSGSGLSPKFTPTIKINPNVIPGQYKGQIVFTVGKL